MIDQVEESEQVSIRKGGRLIYYDPETGIGYEMKDPSEPLREMTEKQKEEFAKGITDAFGATTRIIGEEKIAGKNCVITETVTVVGGDTTVVKEWRWENFILKLDAEGMGTKTHKIARSVQVGVRIDKTLCDVPPDVDITKY